MSNRRVAALVLAAIALSGCWVAEESVGGGGVGTAEFGAGKLVECRVLGGKTVFVEWADGEGGRSTTVQRGIPKGSNPGAFAETQIGPGPKKRRAEQRELRANGWDPASVRDLLELPDDYEMASATGFKGSEAEFTARKRELQARLERMPSCLDEARDQAGDR